MSYPLILLGLLAEQPRYGYDLKQTIEHRSFADFVRLSGGGLYYHLRKLRAEGYIEEQTVEHEGNYPDRHIFRITPQGRAYFLQLLRETLDDVAGRRSYDPLDAALAFAGLLPPEEVGARLQRQLDYLRPQLLLLQALHDLNETLPQYVDLYSQLIIEHAIQRLTAGIGWLETAIAQIREAAANAPHRLRTGAAAREGMAQRAGLPLDRLATLLAPYEKAFSEGATQGYGAMREAEARYRQTAGEAGRMYEASLRTSRGDAAATARAHQQYSDQVAEAWRTYRAVIEATKRETHAAFAETAQALEQALRHAGGDERHSGKRPLEEG